MAVILSFLWTIFIILPGETLLLLLIGKKLRLLTFLEHICLFFSFGIISSILLIFILSIFHLQYWYAYVLCNILIALPGIVNFRKNFSYYRSLLAKKKNYWDIAGIILIVLFLIYIGLTLQQYNYFINGDSYYFLGRAIEIVHYKANILNPHYLGEYKNVLVGDFFLCAYVFVFQYDLLFIIVRYLPIMFAFFFLLAAYTVGKKYFQKPYAGVIILGLTFASKIYSTYLFSYSKHSVALLVFFTFCFLIFDSRYNSIFLAGFLVSCLYFIHSPTCLFILIGFPLYFYYTFLNSLQKRSKFISALKKISTSLLLNVKFVVIITFVYLLLIVVGFYTSSRNTPYIPMNLFDWNNLSANILLSFTSVVLCFLFYLNFKKTQSIPKMMLYVCFFHLIFFFLINNVYWLFTFTSIPYTVYRLTKYFEFSMILIIGYYISSKIHLGYLRIKFVFMELRKKQQLSIKISSLFGEILLIAIICSSLYSSTYNFSHEFFIDEMQTKTSPEFITLSTWTRENTESGSIFLLPYENSPRFNTHYGSAFFFDHIIVVGENRAYFQQNDIAYKTNSLKYEHFVTWVYFGQKTIDKYSGIEQMNNLSDSIVDKIDFIILYTATNFYLNRLVEMDTAHFSKIYEIKTLEQSYWNFYQSESLPRWFKFCVYEVLDNFSVFSIYHGNNCDASMNIINDSIVQYELEDNSNTSLSSIFYLLGKNFEFGTISGAIKSNTTHNAPAHIILKNSSRILSSLIFSEGIIGCYNGQDFNWSAISYSPNQFYTFSLEWVISSGKMTCYFLFDNIFQLTWTSVWTNLFPSRIEFSSGTLQSNYSITFSNLTVQTT